MKIAVAGFCWGCQYVVMLAQDMPSSRAHRASSEANQVESLIDCGFAAHPSQVEVPKEIEGVTIPLSIAVGD
jgi:dienelactone hydrolase